MLAAQKLLARKPAEIDFVTVTPKKNTVYTVTALREQQREQQLDAAIVAEGVRIEEDEEQKVANEKKKKAEDLRLKRTRDAADREDRAQKKAKNARRRCKIAPIIRN